MGRCVSFHRFTVIFFLTLCAAGLADAGHPETRMPNASAFSASAVPASTVNSSALARQSTTPQANPREYTLPPARYEKAVAYSRASYTLYFVSVSLTVLVILIILQLGIAARFRDWAESASDQRWVQGVVFAPLLVMVLAIASLPVRLYGHVLSLRYEMSVQGWGSWFQDWFKEQLLMAGLGLILVLGLSVVLRKSPRRWWFYSWLAALPVLLFFVFVAPWFIDPLFNTFEPLQAEHPDLVSAIENLTRHAGVPIPRDRMFLMKASEKTNEINAYVTGVGASKRVVIWDTTIQKATLNETLCIVGHELGHYVLGHVWKGFLFAAGLLFVGFYALFRGLHWTLDRWSGDWRIYGQEDWASFAVLLLLLEIGMFLAAPVVNGFSRMQEHAADVYAVEVIHGLVPDSSEVAAQTFQDLGELDLSDPDPSPIITFWLYSHPPINDRLVFARSYDPWAKGESTKYVK
jgi:STE24 endopeptidase